MFQLANPDGYFYLLFLKKTIQMFTINLVAIGSIMAYICYQSNTNDGTLSSIDLKSISNLELISLFYSLSDPKVYYMALVLMFISSTIAYVFLIGFCSEMTEFEF